MIKISAPQKPTRTRKPKKPSRATAGQPTKYSQKMIDKIQLYLDQCKDEYHRHVTSESEKGSSYKYYLRASLPTIEGLALFCGINKSSIYEWKGIHPEYSNALSRIEIEQKQRLVNMGLSGEYNPTIVKLMLMNNHGFSEKTENQNQNTHTLENTKFSDLFE